MNARLRDGLLAVAAFVVLVAVAAAADATATLAEPGAAVVGVVGSLALELAFLRYPDRTQGLWERPLVQAVSFALVTGVGIVAIRSGVGWVVAALAWGLVAYLLLLGVVVGLGKNPLAERVAR